MKRKWMFVAPLMILIFVAVGGEIVQHLWNWLMPELFQARQITFPQALGLLVLCRILFGGFCGRGFRRSRSRKCAGERWKQMTPEEREKLRDGLRSRWGGFGAKPGEPE